MSASCLLSRAQAHVIISSSKSRCSVISALISPPRTQDSQPLVFTFPKPWSGRRCSKMILKQQDGDPLVSCEINFMGCNQHYQQQQSQVGCVKKGICVNGDASPQGNEIPGRSKGVQSGRRMPLVGPVCLPQASLPPSIQSCPSSPTSGPGSLVKSTGGGTTHPLHAQPPV